MAMSMTYFIMGGFVTFLGLFLIGGIVGIWYLGREAMYNRHIRITNWTAGTPYIEWYRARKTKHRELGDIYEIPKLKKEKRQYIPYFGTDKEFPMNRNKQFYVPVTYYNGVYVPESYNPYSEQEIEVIEPAKNEKGKDTFKKIKKKITVFITKTIPQSNRMFYLKSDVAIEQEFTADPGWWAKNGQYVVAISIIVIAGVVATMMIIFGYEAYSDLVSKTAPPWLNTLIDAIGGGQAPPAQ